MEMVASHVKASVHMKAAQNTRELGGLSQQITNPLFEDHGGIQTSETRFSQI